MTHPPPKTGVTGVDVNSQDIGNRCQNVTLTKYHKGCFVGVKMSFGHFEGEKVWFKVPNNFGMKG
jgi:hypothetical protein